MQGSDNRVIVPAKLLTTIQALMILKRKTPTPSVAEVQLDDDLWFNSSQQSRTFLQRELPPSSDF